VRHPIRPRFPGVLNPADGNVDRRYRQTCWVSWVPPELAREGIWSRLLEVLLDLERPHRERVHPCPPGASPVYDRDGYARARERGLARWVQVCEHYQSLSEDHYVLTDDGREVLRRYRTAVEKLAQPAVRT
jgi:hypothetical protein